MALHPAILSMLGKYKCETKQEYKNALKEIIQEVALLGLARYKFFDKASFYGGTALRIAHNLDRYSEDLDFELNSKDDKLDLQNYFEGIDNELSTYGLNLKAEIKEKSNKESTTDSAFIKGNTLEHLLLIEGLDDPQKGIHKDELLKVRFEIDIDPPNTPPLREVKFHQNPIPYSYKILDLPSLYSGKLHAVLCRNWSGGRVKGRDFYDYLWYQKNNVSPNFDYLKAKLVQSGRWKEKIPFSEIELKDFLHAKFKEVDWQQAKADVTPFIRDTYALEVWSEDFFNSTLEN